MRIGRTQVEITKVKNLLSMGIEEEKILSNLYFLKEKGKEAIKFIKEHMSDTEDEIYAGLNLE